jgi:ADP-heptose:LPS heptosyltransferase
VTKTLAVRLDSLGDVLVTGPAVRALAASSSSLTVLAGPLGRPAAELLPGVDEVLCWRAPWIDARPEPVDREHVEQLRGDLEARRFDRAVVFTSFHQSALPTALVLRLAGVPWVGAISEDYPGSLLDVRHQVPEQLPEPVRALSLAAACGAPLPPGDDGSLAVRLDARRLLPPGIEPPYVVLHPGTSVPARAWPADRFREACALLVSEGHRVLVTGLRERRERRRRPRRSHRPRRSGARAGPRPGGGGRKHRSRAPRRRGRHARRVAVRAHRPGRAMGAVRRAAGAAG